MEYVGFGLIFYSMFRMMVTMDIEKKNMAIAVFGLIFISISIYQDAYNVQEAFKNGKNVYREGIVISKKEGWSLKDGKFIRSGKYIKLSFF